jgi:uncharacterized protein (TIGR02996 family)
MPPHRHSATRTDRHKIEDGTEVRSDSSLSCKYSRGLGRLSRFAPTGNAIASSTILTRQVIHEIPPARTEAMTHEEAFLEAIREQPDDDTPRLIYADWLEEYGQPERAEFIRVQCEKERVPEGSPRWFDLSIREEELRAAYEHEWLGPFGGIIEQHEFHRGCLDSVFLEAQAFLEHAEGLFRLGPLRQVSLEDAAEVLPTLADSPWLERLTVLDLSDNDLGPEELRILAGSPHLTRLTGLILDHNPIGPEGADVLRRAPFFAGLRALYLCGTQLGATGIEYLTARRGPVALRELSLDRNNLGSAGVQALTAAPSFCQGLTRLSLAGTNMEEAGLYSLIRARCLQGLIDLSVGQNPLGGGWDRRSQEPSTSRNLAFLDLSSTRLGIVGAATLPEMFPLDNLTILDLSGNPFGATGISALLAPNRLKRLTLLDLSGNEIGDEGAKALAGAPQLANLTTLRLLGNGLSMFGVRELIQSEHLCRLHTLELQGNRLGDQGAQVIARWACLPQLAELNLRDNRIGDLGAKELADSPHLPCLRVLNLSNNAISKDMIEALENSPLSDRLAELDLSHKDVRV